jgi:hypothetical protein
MLQDVLIRLMRLERDQSPPRTISYRRASKTRTARPIVATRHDTSHAKDVVMRADEGVDFDANWARPQRRRAPNSSPFRRSRGLVCGCGGQR